MIGQREPEIYSEYGKLEEKHFLFWKQSQMWVGGWWGQNPKLLLTSTEMPWNDMNLWTIEPLEVVGWGLHFRGHTEVNSDINSKKCFIFLRKKPQTDKRYLAYLALLRGFVSPLPSCGWSGLDGVVLENALTSCNYISGSKLCKWRRCCLRIIFIIS